MLMQSLNWGWAPRTLVCQQTAEKTYLAMSVWATAADLTELSLLLVSKHAAIWEDKLQN